MNLKNILKTLGPGILFAGAAIGGSHLVQSTRAGAGYGFSLIWLIIVVNFLKYPFFEFGHRYAAATGENMIDGYKKLGTWAVVTFFMLSIVTAIVNIAGVSFVTAALLNFFIDTYFSMNFGVGPISAVLMLFTILMLWSGQYPLLDKVVKFLIVILAISTIVAFFFAADNGMNISPDFIQPELWTYGGIVFLISLMGWMPAPIELSVWPSMWSKERIKQTGYKPKFKEVFVDFYTGYVGTSILALFFVGLGAYIMYGSGETFANSSVEFSKQLVSLYTKTLGNWALPIITIIAFFTMLSTTLTCVDGYPRTLEASMYHIFKMKVLKNNGLYWIWLIGLAILSLVVIFFLTSGLKTMIDIATTISFLVAPIFAGINFKLITSKHVPKKAQPNGFVRTVSWIGMLYLSGFSILYILLQIGFIEL